jgi:hypothetical protein
MPKYTKFIVVAGALTALAVPSAALANSKGIGPAVPGASAVVAGSYVGGTTQGKGVTQYRAAYSDWFGPVSCIGTNHAAVVGKAAEFDSFTCTSTSGSPLANVVPNESLSLATFGAWVSDFDGHSAKTFTGTVSADGMSYTATATY